MSTADLREGLCVGADVNVWHPESGTAKWEATEAIAICQRCPASRTCHDFAASTRDERGVYGVYGVLGGIRWNRGKPYPPHVAAMNELWVAQGLDPVPMPDPPAPRRRKPAQPEPEPEAVVVAMPAPKQATTTRPLTIDERRRLRAADAMDVSA